MLKKGKVNKIMDTYWGSSSKGLSSAFLAKEFRPEILISTNRPNAGHSLLFTENDEEFVFKILPTAAGLYKYIENYTPYIFIGPTAGFEIEQLIKEIKWCGIPAGKIIVHPRAMVVTQKHKDMEMAPSSSGGTVHLGSTMSGAGACYAEKVMRGQDTKLAFHYAEELQDYCTIYPDIQAFEFTLHLAKMLDSGMTALAEISQGYPLSLDHGLMYKYATSRNVVPAQLLSDLGLRPDYDGITVGNVRSFPIRVSNRFDVEKVKFAVEYMCDGSRPEVMATDLGFEYNDINPIVQQLVFNNPKTPVKCSKDGKDFLILAITDGINGWSGPYENDMAEISWKELAEIAGINDSNYHEKTTVTKLTRRIFKIKDGSISKDMMGKFKISCDANPIIITTFLNYIDYNANNITSKDQITDKVWDWINQANRDLQDVFGADAKITAVQFGKSLDNIFFL